MAKAVCTSGNVYVQSAWAHALACVQAGVAVNNIEADLDKTQLKARSKMFTGSSPRHALFSQVPKTAVQSIEDSIRIRICKYTAHFGVQRKQLFHFHFSILLIGVKMGANS